MGPAAFNNISEFFSLGPRARLIGDSLCDIFFSSPNGEQRGAEPFPIIPNYCALFESDL